MGFALAVVHILTLNANNSKPLKLQKIRGKCAAGVVYITPAAFRLFAEGDRHQDVTDQREIVYLPEELRVLFGQLLRQVGEVILAQAAKEERPLDDAIAFDRAIPLLLRMVEGFLLAHQCNRIIKGVDCLNVSADRLLQAFKLSADLLCIGALARFNN